LRNVIAVALASLLIGTGAATAQTTSRPGGPSAASAEAGGFSIGAEALMWWFKGAPAPTPLVTDGLLGEPGTKVLLGGQDVDTDPNPGFRVTAGYSLTEGWGVEGSFFYVPPRATSRSVSSSGHVGSTDLFIPFVDVTIPGESVTNLSFAGFFSGRAREELRNSLLGAELYGTMRLPMAGAWRVDLLGGFRYLRLTETYTFSTDSPIIPPLPPDVFQTEDRFDVANHFYGAQLGARAQIDGRSWFASGAVKVALGAMVQSVDVDGRLVTNDFNGFGVPQTFAGGYFAQPTNMGSHGRGVFAVVPEVGLTVGYRITPSVSVVGGYTFLYASDVVRAPAQINRNINPVGRPAFSGDPPAPLVGPAQPSFTFTSSDFWAHGLHVGLAVRF